MIFNGCAALIHLKLEGKTGEIDFFLYIFDHYLLSELRFSLSLTDIRENAF